MSDENLPIAEELKLSDRLLGLAVDVKNLESERDVLACDLRFARGLQAQSLKLLEEQTCKHAQELAQKDEAVDLMIGIAVVGWAAAILLAIGHFGKIF